MADRWGLATWDDCAVHWSMLGSGPLRHVVSKHETVCRQGIGKIRQRSPRFFGPCMMSLAVQQSRYLSLLGVMLRQDQAWRFGEWRHFFSPWWSSAEQNDSLGMFTQQFWDVEVWPTNTCIYIYIYITSHHVVWSMEVWHVWSEIRCIRGLLISSVNVSGLWLFSTYDVSCLEDRSASAFGYARTSVDLLGAG